MKKSAVFFLLLCIGAVLAAQTSQSKKLIMYFSLYGNQKTVQTDADTSASRTIYGGKVCGNTEIVAKMIQETVGGDIVEIKMQNPYPDSYDDVVNMEKVEQRKQTHVSIITKTDVSGYD